MSVDADNARDVDVDSISAGGTDDEQLLQANTSRDNVDISDDRTFNAAIPECKVVDEREKSRNRAIAALSIVCVVITALVITSTVIAYGRLGVDYLVVILMDVATATSITVIASVSLIYRKRRSMIYVASVLAIIFSVATVTFLLVGMAWFWVCIAG